MTKLSSFIFGTLFISSMALADTQIALDGAQTSSWVTQKFNSQEVLMGQMCEVRLVLGCASLGVEIIDKDNGDSLRVEWFEGNAEKPNQLFVRGDYLERLVVPEDSVYGGEVAFFTDKKDGKVLVKLSKGARVELCRLY